MSDNQSRRGERRRVTPLHALNDAGVRRVSWEMPVVMSEEVAAHLGAVGRTEDVAISPDGRRMAIAGFSANVIALVDFEITHEMDAATICLTSVALARSDAMARPHGIAFVDDTTLVVANRESELLLVELTPPGGPPGRVVAETRVIVDGDHPVPVRSPGSVAVRRVASGMFEIVVCNNYAHDLTRYVVDGDDEWAVVDAECLLAKGLEIPDGVALSKSGEWLAVSNHNTSEVLVYRYDDHLGPDAEPAGVLAGANYPHGLRFAANDRWLLLADAGLPFVYAFEAADGDWSGPRHPHAVTRVMDDESFNRGRYNPQEGGPKGIDVIADAVVVVTSEFQPLGFFELTDIVGQPIQDGAPHETPQRTTGVEEDASRRLVVRALRRLDDAVTALADARAVNEQLTRHADDLAQQRDDALTLHGLAGQAAAAAHSAAAASAEAAHTELAAVRVDLAGALEERARCHERVDELTRLVELLHASRSWRVTAPLRRIATIAKILRPRR